MALKIWLYQPPSHSVTLMQIIQRETALYCFSTDHRSTSSPCYIKCYSNETKHAQNISGIHIIIRLATKSGGAADSIENSLKNNKIITWLVMSKLIRSARKKEKWVYNLWGQFEVHNGVRYLNCSSLSKPEEHLKLVAPDVNYNWWSSFIQPPHWDIWMSERHLSFQVTFGYKACQ